MTDLFLTDVIAYYARMGTQPVCFQVHAVKVGATAGTAPGPPVALQGLAEPAGAGGFQQTRAWIPVPPSLSLPASSQ